MSRGDDALAAWRERFQPYVDAARELFAFLEASGYGAPRVTIRPRECVIVYWPEDRESGRANVALYNDLGGEPWVQIVPLTMARADRSTRTFGLNEAMALLAPGREAPPKKAPPLAESDERAWLAWYADFLAERLDEITKPAATLLDAIESSRP